MVGSVVLASGLWSVLVVDKVRFILFWNGADSIRQKAWIRAHPVGYLRIVAHSLFGTWLLVNHTVPGMAAPAWWHLQSRAPGVGESTVSLVVTVAMIVGAFLLACRPRSAHRRRGRAGAGARLASRREELLIWAVLGVILVLVFALVVYGESIASAADLRTNPVINYIEGRYFLPILPLLLLPLAARGRLLDGATSRGLGLGAARLARGADRLDRGPLRPALTSEEAGVRRRRGSSCTCGPSRRGRGRCGRSCPSRT